jgi:hypothetical protein
MIKFFKKLLNVLFKEDNLLTNKSNDPVFEKEKIRFLKAIKLIHCSDLLQWQKFPGYHDHHTLNYYEYFIESEKINKLQDKYFSVINSYNKLLELDTDEMQEYHSFTVPVAGSLFRITRKIKLEKPAYANTVVTVSKGELKDGILSVKAKLFKDYVYVTHSCPARIHHAEEIASIKEKLSKLNGQELDALQEFKESRFTHPVLFISHRWETKEHPDPSGTQLEKLRQLKNCFIIYDYSSFPQQPLSGSEDSDLQLILLYMTKLIKNVVILHSADYINRGWCIYEYIASSFLGSVVCDEMQDAKFVSLRNWVATRVPIPQNLFRDSWESQQQNYINDAILSTVNKILPLYKNALFTIEDDRKIVQGLLLNLLKRKLPAKKEHQLYLGEWKTNRWTDDELKDAFDNELKWNSEISLKRPEFEMDVPKTITEAVQRNYKINRDTSFKTSLF